MNKSIEFIWLDQKACQMCGSTDIRIKGKRLDKSQGFFPHFKKGLTSTVCQCNSCLLIFSNPMPIPKVLASNYQVPSEEYWKDIDALIDHSAFTDIKAILNQELGTVNEKKALDIGAGIGFNMKVLAKMGFDVFGVEPSEPFAKDALKYAPHIAEKISICTWDDYASEIKFDFITFGAVLEHLPNPYFALTKAFNYLEEGGLLHIAVPNSTWLTSELLNRWNKLVFSGFCTNLSPMHEPFHLFEFGRHSFDRFVGENKLTEIYYHNDICEPMLPIFIRNWGLKKMEKENKGMEHVFVWRKSTKPKHLFNVKKKVNN